MSRYTLAARIAAVLALAPVLSHADALAQAPAPGTPAPRHPRVCASGVRTYQGVGEVPKPYDSLAMPPGPPIRVQDPSEAEAAERTVRERAGSVGATGVVIDEESEMGPGGGLIVRRRVFPVFVPSDSARAQQACR
ncbi:MAG TPA: hypothetical protein VEH62_09465 [Gemmatimonadales bacterium]|nr:hypothetical protein [Gemmatimonadales bacterium]